MLSKLRRMLSSDIPRLLDAPETLRYHPHTKNQRVANASVKKYVQVTRRMSEYFVSVGKDPNPLVTKITTEDYAAFHDWLITRDTRIVTANGYRVCAKAVWNHLKKTYRLDVCDISGITKLEPEPFQESHAITDEQLSTILQTGSARDSAMILYMVDGGFRRQTVPRLRLDNTHIWQRPDGKFRIASQIPMEKTSPPRVIMAEHSAAIAMMNWLNIREFQDSPWIFYNQHNGDQLSPLTVSEVFKTLRRRCNIPAHTNVCAHALRHKFAQDKLDSYDYRMVADWMGITVETLMQVYAKRDLNSLITARFGDGNFPVELLR